MLCRFLENGMMDIHPNDYQDRLVIHAVSEKRLIFLYEQGETEIDEQDCKILKDIYKVMREIKGVDKCVNNAYVSEFVKGYNTIFNDKTIYNWIKNYVKKK